MTEREKKLQRERRKRNGNKTTRKYEKTKKGFLMRLYRNMESRVKGIQVKKAHLYYGKELLSRESFYAWAYKSIDFDVMFNDWEESNYDRKLTPTVDRINSDLGYTEDNIRWLTHSENSALGSLSKKRKL